VATKRLVATRWPPNENGFMLRQTGKYWSTSPPKTTQVLENIFFEVAPGTLRNIRGPGPWAQAKLLAAKLLGWLFGCLLAGLLCVGWLAGSWANWLAARMAGWLAAWLAGLLADYLAAGYQPVWQPGWPASLAD
jgi:hypothetical protein